MKHLDTFKQLFERRNIGTVYHFTSLVNTYHIISTNELESYRPIDDAIPKMYKKSPKSEDGTTFSFTRDKNLVKRIGQGQIDTILTTRLDFDGSKLSDKYVIRPYNWQGDVEKQQSLNKKLGKDYFETTKLGSESEQVLITNDNYIKNIQSYMIGMIVPTFDVFKTEFEFYSGSDPSMFYRLSAITDMLGHEEIFNEYETDYDEQLVRETYDYIVETIEIESRVSFKTGVV